MSKCTLEDIVALENITVFWSVGLDGVAVEETDRTEQGDFEDKLLCRNCDNQLNINSVKEHIEGR